MPSSANSRNILSITMRFMCNAQSNISNENERVPFGYHFPIYFQRIWLEMKSFVTAMIYNLYKMSQFSQSHRFSPGKWICLLAKALPKYFENCLFFIWSSIIYHIVVYQNYLFIACLFHIIVIRQENVYIKINWFCLDIKRKSLLNFALYLND